MVGYHPDKKKEVLELLRAENGMISLCARMAGISRKTFYDWLREDKDFAAAYEEICCEIDDKIEKKFYKKIDENDAGCIKFYLITRMRSKYGKQNMRKPLEIGLLETIEDVDKTSLLLIQKLASGEYAESDIMPIQKLLMDRREILQTKLIDEKLTKLELNENTMA